MSKLLARIVIFALPILGFLGYLEHALRAFPNNWTVKRAALERVLNDTEVLITGSSHSFYGIRPSLLSPHTFSLAYTAQDLYYDTRLTLKYLDRMPKLGTVVIPVSYASLEYSVDDSSEQRYAEAFYYHVYRIPEEGRLPTLAHYSLIALYGPHYARKLMRSSVGFSSDVGEDGGCRDERATDSSGTAETQVVLARHHSVMSPHTAVGNLRYIEELLAALRARGIRAVFVTTPVSRAYHAGIRPVSYRRMQDAVAGFCVRYGLQYFDHMQDLRFSEADFMDPDHLDTLGAMKFTRIIRSEIFGGAP